jgi:hypothetical protein
MTTPRKDAPVTEAGRHIPSALWDAAADAIHAAQFGPLQPGVGHGEVGPDCDCYAAAEAVLNLAATAARSDEIDVETLARAMWQEGIAPFRSRSKAEQHGFDERYRRNAADLLARLRSGTVR